MTGVSRSGTVDGVDDPDFEAIAGDATDPDDVAKLAAGTLVVDDDGDSHVSMEDYAVAFVDELVAGDAIHTQLGVGY